LPASVIERIVRGDARIFEEIELAILARPVLINVVGVYNDSEELCGMIAVCAQNHGWGDMAEELTRTVIVAALLVVIASMVAIYLISERTTAPLRQMAMVARRIANGEFDSRVNVKGNDEVAALAAAFNQMAESLENLETMRTSFIANVSHDLRTPMTTIAGFIDGIREGVIPPSEQSHYLEVISVEVRRLSRLVTSLLDLSRIQAGDRKFTMRPFDICEMGRIILISFEQPLEEKRLDVEFLCDEDRITVNADYDAIYQVFYNICDNAVKFSYEGGVFRVSVCREQDTKNKIRVSVYNQGDGIAKEDIPFVFERFYKGDKSRGLDRKGMGLGLYICKTIMVAHKEDIRVSSVEGKDCQFSFTLTEPPMPKD
jgi:signal transduction histidine kinase